MVIYQLSNEFWKPVRTANYATNGYPTRIATTTKPSGDGVIDMAGGSAIPGHILLLPYATDASSHTFSMKVLLWDDTNINPGNPQKRLWIPVEACTIAVTVGTQTGVDGSDLDSTQHFATTITMTGGPTFITSGPALPTSLDWWQISPGSNATGLVSVPTFGFKVVEVIFTTGGVVTDCNALYKKF